MFYIAISFSHQFPDGDRDAADQKIDEETPVSLE